MTRSYTSAAQSNQIRGLIVTAELQYNHQFLENVETMNGVVFVLLVIHASIVTSKEAFISDQHYWNISLADFHEVVTSGNALVVDVREPDEVEVVHVDAKSYVNVPLKQLGGALNIGKEEFAEKYNHEKPKEDDSLIFICRSGKRSDTAVRIARENKYLNTRHYNKGHIGWVNNYPDLNIRTKVDETIKQEL